MIGRGDAKWYTLRTAVGRGAERFMIALAFNANETKGIYLCYDKNVETSHSFTGLLRRLHAG